MVASSLGFGLLISRLFFSSFSWSLVFPQSRKKFLLGTGPCGLSQSSVCLGAEVLTKLLGNYCQNAGIKTAIIVGVAGVSIWHVYLCMCVWWCVTFDSGIPNVGKSSILNSLKRSKVCSVGATPGVTKWVRWMQHVYVCVYMRAFWLMSWSADEIPL